MIDFRRIEAMSPDELREEVSHWRQTFACYLSDALRAVEDPAAAKHWRREHSPGRRVRELAAVLAQALTGEEMFPSCERCGSPVKPGQLVVRFDDVGEVHAACAGAEADQLHEGGRIDVPAEMCVLEEGEPAPADPHLPIFTASDLYTPEQIAGWLAKGRAWLTSPAGRRVL